MEKEKLLLMNEGLNSTAAPTWSSCNLSSKQLTKNCYLNQSDPFESALSSTVSSPAASIATTTTGVIIPPGAGDDDNNNNNINVVMIRELIGRLGNICNSGEISPPKLNLSMISSSSSNLLIPAADPGFSDRLSCFPAADSKEDSSLSEQITSQTVTDSNPRKRKSIPRSKVMETPSTIDPKVVAENTEESNSKRSKQDESDSSKAKDNSKAVEPPKDYIHVRARRGQATDSHSLAERVRREKISERMRFLQDLVPGCNKVTGKAVMLDEIINYVQSLQRQVEFLSMKLSTVNPRMDLNMEALLSKDMFQSRGSLRQSLYPVDCSEQAFPFGYQPQQGTELHLTGDITSNAENQFSISPSNAALLRNRDIQLPPINGYYREADHLVPSLWEDDLQSLVQMGFNQNQPQSLNGSMAATEDGN